MKSGSHSIIIIFSLFISLLMCEVDYGDIQDIFTDNCTTCHGSSGGLNLTSYTNVMAGTSNNGPIITAGNGSTSIIIQ